MNPAAHTDLDSDVSQADPCSCASEAWLVVIRVQQANGTLNLAAAQLDL